MKLPLHFYSKKLPLVTILLIVLLLIFGYNKQLRGFHFFENIISNGEYTFYVTPTQTAYHTFCVSKFLVDADYEVYNVQTNELVNTGNIGFTSEAYYPFIEMNLKKGNLYKVTLDLGEERQSGLAYIDLYLD